MPAAAVGPANILLVEDEEVVRELVTDMLSHAGYDVQATGDPQRALEIASDAGPIDLLITDLVMPGMNGRRLAERLEQIRPGTPVLFTSGYAGDDVARGRRARRGPAFPSEAVHRGRDRGGGTHVARRRRARIASRGRAAAARPMGCFLRFP